MPFQYIVAFIVSSSWVCPGCCRCGGDTITLHAFGVVWELSSYHPCTPCMYFQRVWNPVLCLVLYCTWSNACCWLFAPPQSLVRQEERSPLHCYGLQTLGSGCILVYIAGVELIVTAPEFWESVPLYNGLHFCWHSKHSMVALASCVDRGHLQPCYVSLLYRQSQE